MVGRRIKSIWPLMFATFVLAGACATVPAPPHDRAEVGPAVRETDVTPLLARAEEALGLGRHAEAIQLLAEAALRSPGTEAGASAEAQLRMIGSRLTIEPGSAWIASDGTQVTGSAMDLVANDRLLPSVLATLSEGPARVAVHDLTLEFTYVAGDTVVDTFTVRTSEFGTAAAPPPRGVTIAQSLMVAVRPVVETAAGTYRVPTEAVTFDYIGAANTYGAVALEVRGGKAQHSSALLDTAILHLRGAGGVTSADAGLGDEMAALARGDGEIVVSMSRRLDCTLLAVSVVDIQDVTQMEYSGRLYDIWTTDAIVRFTVYDPSGPRTVTSYSSGLINGQGGSESDAIADAIRTAAGTLDSLLGSVASELRRYAAGQIE